MAQSNLTPPPVWATWMEIGTHKPVCSGEKPNQPPFLVHKIGYTQREMRLSWREMLLAGRKGILFMIKYEVSETQSGVQPQWESEETDVSAVLSRGGEVRAAEDRVLPSTNCMFRAT